MQFTTINDIWTEFDSMCDEAPSWDRDDLRERIKQRFPNKTYAEITPDDVAELVAEMNDEDESAA